MNHYTPGCTCWRCAEHRATAREVLQRAVVACVGAADPAVSQEAAGRIRSLLAEYADPTPYARVNGDRVSA